jgi:valyl-tRNA synthetase
VAGVKPGATVPARLAAGGYEDTGEHVARLARLSFTSPDESSAAHSGEAGCRAGGRLDGAEPVATVPVPGGSVELLASEHVDLEAAERKRAAQRATLQAEVERAERKLANQGFVSKAPPHVVQAEREKLERARAELEAL